MRRSKDLLRPFFAEVPPKLRGCLAIAFSLLYDAMEGISEKETERTGEIAVIVLNVLLTALVLFLPFCVGCLFKHKSISFTYLSGQLVLWAAFQVAAVPCVYFRASFTLLFWIFTGIAAVLTFFGIRSGLKIRFEKPEISIFLVAALLVIAFQCGVYIFGMHLDEDDARWLAEANDALVKDRMLLHNPATGEYIGRFVGEMVKDVYSPWPFYISWMSRMTAVRAAVIAHTVYPPVLLLLSYAAYYELGRQLFKGKSERGIFLLMVAVINLFMAGNVYTQSVFTLTRIWQGKAVVAAVMIPLFLTLAVKLQGENEDTVSNWILLGVSGCAACLFSGMGIAIGLLMIAIYGAYVVVRGIIVRKKEGWKRVPLWLLSMAPGLVYGIGYYLLRQ